jgi:hypothetical protein
MWLDSPYPISAHLPILYLDHFTSNSIKGCYYSHENKPRHSPKNRLQPIQKINSSILSDLSGVEFMCAKFSGTFQALSPSIPAPGIWLGQLAI